MTTTQKKISPPAGTITFNKKASFRYQLQERFQAGLSLEGWEVKSIRGGKVQISEAYVILQAGEAWLLGSHISPFASASTHIKPNPTRNRKLLLTAKELNKLIGATQQKGFTLVPVSLFWKNNRIKLEIALAKGKKDHDRRTDEKDRDWAREKSRVLKTTLKRRD